MTEDRDSRDSQLSAAFYGVTLAATAGASEDTLHAIDECPVSANALKLLHILVRPHRRPPRVSRVGEMLRVSSASATRIVTRLEDERLVDRVDDEHDARVKRVVLTPKGRELVGELERVRCRSIDRFVMSLSEAERDALYEPMTALARRPDIAPLVPE